MPVWSAGDWNDLPGVIDHLRAGHKTQVSWFPFYSSNNQNQCYNTAHYSPYLCSEMNVNVICQLNVWIMSPLTVALLLSACRVKQCCLYFWNEEESRTIDLNGSWHGMSYWSVMSYRKILPSIQISWWYQHKRWYLVALPNCYLLASSLPPPTLLSAQ